MTVINMLSLGEEGLAVADEQSSTFLRKYNVAQKLQFLNDSIIYGGSGPANIIREIFDFSSDELKKTGEQKNISIREVYDLVSGITIKYINQLRDSALKANCGIGLDDFLTGRLIRVGKPLDENLKNYGVSLMKELSEKSSLSILLGGFHSNRFAIYEVNSGGIGMKISRLYASIGSGSDESDKILSSYITHLPRDKRESIDKNEGLIKIIEATNASSRLNVGVGGIPSIIYLSKDKIIRPSENQCILASEIVEGFTRNLLDKGLTYLTLSKLIFENGDFEQIEEEIKQKSDWKKLDMILRGYKL